MVKPYPLLFLALMLLLTILAALISGRYPITASEIFEICLSMINGQELTHKQEEIKFLLLELRLPRILAAVLIGAALSSSGTVYQGMFLNPLVSPEILGVLAGASFGAAFGIVILNSWYATQLLAFVFAIIAVILSLLLGKVFRPSMLVLILSGMISSSLFTALTSLLKYIADPSNQLPELIYWLMGTLSRVNMSIVLKMGCIIVPGVLFLATSGKIVNAISMGDEEAKALGVDVSKIRLVLICVATLVSASTVVLVGVIQWIGLVIPHMMRFFIGTDNRRLLPASALGGAIFLLVADTIVRSAFTIELPIGIVTALVGLPLFALSIYKNKGMWR